MTSKENTNSFKQLNQSNQMATKKTKYYRKFRGENLEPLDPHSPNKINKEDEKIRKNITNKFSGNTSFTKSGKEIHHGFDGSQQYYFKFYEENWDRKDKNNPTYLSIIEISKTGNETMIQEFPSDLEQYITKNKGPKFKKRK
jgi:hypothetical protein